MKKNIIIYTLAAVCLLLSGCSQKISEDKAKEIALSHADLPAEKVTFTKSSMERDGLRSSYDIEFYTQDQLEYNYEIDCYDGEILEWDIEALYDDINRLSPK